MIYHTFIMLAFTDLNRDKNFTRLNRTQEGHVELDAARFHEKGRPRRRKLHRFLVCYLLFCPRTEQSVFVVIHHDAGVPLYGLAI